MGVATTVKRFAVPAANPRKVSTGTSYQAKGLIPPSPSLDSESGSGQPVVVRELVPELSGFNKAATYAKMMNYASVDVSMRAAKTPILGSEFFMEPYSDNPADIEISEFIEDNLWGGMSAPFVNSLQDILGMFEDGYSVVEKVYEEREWGPKRTMANRRNYVMLKKLGVRPTSTLAGISYDDNGGPEKITHNAIRADKSVDEVELDIANLIVFTLNRKGGNLEGKSLLRTAYPHWYYMTHFYKIDAIQKERFSLGILKGKLMPGYNKKDIALLRQMLRNYRTNEEQFMVLPPNIDVEIEFPPGTPVNVLDSAVHHSAMIMLNILGQFIMLGVEGGGGRATAATQSDLFMKSLKYIAGYIAEQINMYLIPELVVWNFPTTNFPKLKVRNIGETRDLQMLGSALGNLFSQDAITWTPETELWIRKVFDMPNVPIDVLLQRLTKSEAVEDEGGFTNGNGNGKGQMGNIKHKPGDAGNVGKPPVGTN
jgi:hypothetical protein